jgi:hypothetical protein
MKTTARSAAQIDTLFQRLSAPLMEPASSTRKASDNLARPLVARIGEERAARAFTSTLPAGTFDQAEARLTLVLDYGNSEPAGEPVSVVAEEPEPAIAPTIGKRKPSLISRRPARCRPRMIFPSRSTPDSMPSWLRS